MPVGLKISLSASAERSLRIVQGSGRFLDRYAFERSPQRRHTLYRHIVHAEIGVEFTAQQSGAKVARYEVSVLYLIVSRDSIDSGAQRGGLKRESRTAHLASGDESFERRTSWDLLIAQRARDRDRTQRQGSIA